MPLDFQEIRKIVKLMNEHELTYFHIEQKDFNLKLKKGPDADALRGLLGSLPAPVASAPAGPAAAAAPGAEPAASAVAEGDEITSPMVGTFYGRSKPEADSFVSTGDQVSEGQTLCIIEAMKVMNEIKAERSGTITETPVADGTPVQFGDTLFRIK